MMMAPDSSLPPRRRLSSETLQTVERALADVARDGADESVVNAALERMAREARQHAIPPEEVLVELKQMWSALPGAASRSAAGEQSRILQRIVTMCIKSYYR